jgi:RNA polymerase sigma-70 factor (ECF subfamily)
VNVDAVFNVAQRLLWNRADAEDVVQTTFLKALTRIDQLRDNERVRPLLLQIAYRDAIALLRRRRDRPTDPSLLPEHAATQPGPSDIAIAFDMARIVTLTLSST